MTQKNNIFHLLFFSACMSAACVAKSQVYPVKISQNRRYLVDQHNRPYPILGRTAWFVTSLPVDQYHQFITNTIFKGYNAIEMSAINHDPRGNNAPFNGNGDLPFLKCLDGTRWGGQLSFEDTAIAPPDFTTPNEKYWLFLDSFLSYCSLKHITVFIFPGYLGAGGGKEGWMQELVANGPSKIEAYGKFIAARYKHQKNLVWMLLGDMGQFTAPRKAVEAALISGLKTVPGQQSGYYSAEANSGQNSADQPDFGDQMTLNGVYDWNGKVTEPGRKAYAHQPPLPAFLLEEPYDEEGPDGNNVNPGATQPVRRFQWGGWLCTIAGYISGNGYVWGFRSPDWQNHLDTKGAKEMSLLNSFIRSIAWWRLVPSGLDGMKTLITKGGGLPDQQDYVASAADITGRLLVAYIPPLHKGSVEVDMTVMRGAVRAYWYDPTNGDTIKIKTVYLNKEKQEFVPRAMNSGGDRDWVLVLQIN